MIRRRLLIESLRGLRRYKVRSTFVAFGTLVGIALVTLVLSLNQGVQRKIGATIRQIFGGDAILVGARGTSLLGGPRPDAARLTIDDIAAVADAVPGIAAWDPQQARPAAAVKAGARAATVRVLGQSARSPRVWDRPAIRGRFFDDEQVRTAARVAVIGESAAASAVPGERSDRPGAADRVGAVHGHRRAAALRHRHPRHGSRQRDRRPGDHADAARAERRHDRHGQAGRRGPRPRRRRRRRHPPRAARTPCAAAGPARRLHDADPARGARDVGHGAAHHVDLRAAGGDDPRRRERGHHGAADAVVGEPAARRGRPAARGRRDGQRHRRAVHPGNRRHGRRRRARRRRARASPRRGSWRGPTRSTRSTPAWRCWPGSRSRSPPACSPAGCRRGAPPASSPPSPCDEADAQPAAVGARDRGQPGARGAGPGDDRRRGRRRSSRPARWAPAPSARWRRRWPRSAPT